MYTDTPVTKNCRDTCKINLHKKTIPLPVHDGAVQTGRGIYMVQSVCICSHDIISHLSEAYQRFFEKKL